MAIKTVDVDANTRDLAGKITDAKKGVQNTVQGVKFSTFTGENFAGMDSSKIPEFRGAVKKLQSDVNEVLKNLETNTPTTGAFKGDVAEAVHGFLVSMRYLFEKYVAAIEAEAKEVEEANTRWLEAAGKLKSNVDADSYDILGDANSLIDLG